MNGLLEAPLYSPTSGNLRQYARQPTIPASPSPLRPTSNALNTTHSNVETTQPVPSPALSQKEAGSNHRPATSPPTNLFREDPYGWPLIISPPGSSVAFDNIQSAAASQIASSVNEMPQPEAIPAVVSSPDLRPKKRRMLSQKDKNAKVKEVGGTKRGFSNGFGLFGSARSKKAETFDLPVINHRMSRGSIPSPPILRPRRSTIDMA